MPSTISVPCSGGGGVVFKELLKEGKKEREVSSKMYCGANAKIPSIVSTGVRLEIYFKAPVTIPFQDSFEVGLLDEPKK